MTHTVVTASAPTTATTSRNTQAPKPSEPVTQDKTPPKSSGHGPPLTKQPPNQGKQLAPQLKKLPGRSSKPIINWFQRKLTGRAVKPNARVPEEEKTANSQTPNGTVRGQARSTGSKPSARVASSPLPQPTLLVPPRHSRNDSSSAAARRKTISLNGDDDGQNRSFQSEDDEDMDRSTNRSSLARESTWSPTSNMEADEDASVRPLPPSGPPSPSPSLSASSYLSDPHTFRSMAASTKPTTLLSIDLTPAGMAHIAQAPNTPSIQPPRFLPHVRNNSAGTSGGVVGSGASITFSALPPSPQTDSRPSSLNNVTAGSPNPNNQQSNSVQAPLHTAHHPRNNPRPSSPPMDNASMLTLASSAFAVPGTRMGLGSQVWTSGPPSAMAGDSISHFGGSFVGDGEGDVSSQYVIGDGLDVDRERDVDASIRALRPRSSRRGSWDSEASDWSAPVGSTGPGMSIGTPSRSLWTTNSVRTGGDGANGRSEDNGSVSNSERRSLEPQTPLQISEPLPGDEEGAVEASEITPVPKGETTPKRNQGHELEPSLEELSSAVPLPDLPTPKGERDAAANATQNGGEHKVTENGHGRLEPQSPDDAKSPIEVWHSAPSTPMV